MNCEEIFTLLKKEAPTVEGCLTKNEIHDKSDKLKRGISGARLVKCLRSLQQEGRVKSGEKCVQFGKCYYDPPIEAQFDFFAVGIIAFALALNIIILFASKSPAFYKPVKFDYVALPVYRPANVLKSR